MDVDSPPPQPCQPQANSEYNVAIVCALRAESNAVEGLLDGIWPGDGFVKSSYDNNSYRTGWISGHNVVLAYMPGMGKANAAQVATHLGYKFDSIKLCVLVGFCGGVPINASGDEIRLGDVVISTAIVEYDSRKQYPDSCKIRATVNQTPPAVASFLHKLSGKLGREPLMKSTSRHTQELLAKLDFKTFQYLGIHMDRLYQPDYIHKHQRSDDCAVCSSSPSNNSSLGSMVCDVARASSCAEVGCEEGKVLCRTVTASGRPSDMNMPVIHFGCVGSGDTVMKSGQERDRIATAEGVCDYSDSHKSKQWQPYAAATAAACMKAVLAEWPKSKRSTNPLGPSTGEQVESDLTRVSSSALLSDSSWLSQTHTGIFTAPRSAQLDLIEKKCEKSLTKAEIVQFQLVTLQKLYESIERIQQRHASTQNLQGMIMIGKFIEAIVRFEEICQPLRPSMKPNSRFVWGPLKFLLERTYEHTDAFGLLLEMYHNLGISILRSLQSSTRQLSSDHNNSATTLVAIFHFIVTFNINAIRFFRKQVWSVLFPVCSDILKSTLSAIVQQVEERVSIEKGDLNLGKLERTASEAITNQLEAVQRWLSASKSIDDLEKFRAKREGYPQSGRWLLSNPLLQSWMNPEEYTNPQLWLTGIPGSGKTILASLVIEEAQKIKDATVVYFFCRHRDPNRNTFLAVMSGILSQLLVRDRDLVPYFYDHFSRTGEITLTTFSIVKALMQTALRNFDALYIVIDGLDECKREERKEISQWFQNPLDSCSSMDRPNIRCLFVSQDDGYARKDFKHLPVIKISSKDNRQDIEVYCRARASEIQSKFRISNQQRDLITNSTMRFADGMFLYVALVMSNLFGQINVSSLNQELQADKFPKGLEEAYDRIIQTIKATGPANVRYHAFRLLGWLVCSPRPLKWYEVQGAVSVDFEAKDVNWQENQFQVDAKDLCFSLVEISVDQTVQLVHKTADNFLQKNHINRYEEELQLSIRCLSYLNLPGCSSNLPKIELQKKIETGYYSFLEYAVTYWAKHFDNVCGHLNQAKLDVPRELIVNIEEFLQLHWVEGCSDDDTQLPESVRKKMEKLSSYPFARRIGLAVSVTNKQLTSYGRVVSSPTFLDTSQILAQVRVEFEHLVEQFTAEGPTQERSDSLRRFYGLNPYRCPRSSCFYFHSGFLKELERRLHIDQHERPYLCTFLQQGCEKAIDGFASEKLLKQHLAKVHRSKDSQDDDVFPEAQDPGASVTTRVKCDDSSCRQTFTWRHNMLAHFKRAHGLWKPYSCSHENCHARFTTRNERKRHERTHQIGAQIYSCTGCGRDFQRKDALLRHHRTERGKACISTTGEQHEPDDTQAQLETTVAIVETIDLAPIDRTRADWGLPLPGPSSLLPHSPSSAVNFPADCMDIDSQYGLIADEDAMDLD